MTRKPIRTYSVHVDGYADALCSARSPGKARAAAYRDFTAAHTTTFRERLAIARAHRVADPPGIGKRIIVAGPPATRCSGRGGRCVRFMRDDGDVPMCSHPADASSVPQQTGAAPC